MWCGARGRPARRRRSGLVHLHSSPCLRKPIQDICTQEYAHKGGHLTGERRRGAQLSTYKVLRRNAHGEALSPSSRGANQAPRDEPGHAPHSEHGPEACFEDAQETLMLSEFCDRGAPEGAHEIAALL